MRFLDPPALDSPMTGRPEEDLDGLLNAFFRSEMPNPWPSAPLAEDTSRLLPLRMPTRKSLFRSRLALAASVAFLLAGPWLLSGSFKQLKPESAIPSLEAGSASKAFIEVLPDGTSVYRIEMKQGAKKPAEKKSLVDDMDDLLPKR